MNRIIEANDCVIIFLNVISLFFLSIVDKLNLFIIHEFYVTQFNFFFRLYRSKKQKEKVSNILSIIFLTIFTLPKDNNIPSYSYLK